MSDLMIGSDAGEIRGCEYRPVRKNEVDVAAAHILHGLHDLPRGLLLYPYDMKSLSFPVRPALLSEGAFSD